MRGDGSGPLQRHLCGADWQWMAPSSCPMEPEVDMDPDPEPDPDAGARPRARVRAPCSRPSAPSARPAAARSSAGAASRSARAVAPAPRKRARRAAIAAATWTASTAAADADRADARASPTATVARRAVAAVVVTEPRRALRYDAYRLREARRDPACCSIQSCVWRWSVSVSRFWPPAPGVTRRKTPGQRATRVWSTARPTRR